MWCSHQLLLKFIHLVPTSVCIAATLTVFSRCWSLASSLIQFRCSTCLEFAAKPVCNVSPLCLGSKPSSRLSSYLDGLFHKPRQTIPVAIDCVYVNVSVCVWMVSSSAFFVFVLQRFAFYKSYPLLLFLLLLLFRFIAVQVFKQNLINNNVRVAKATSWATRLFVCHLFLLFLKGCHWWKFTSNVQAIADEEQ